MVIHAVDGFRKVCNVFGLVVGRQLTSDSIARSAKYDKMVFGELFTSDTTFSFRSIVGPMIIVSGALEILDRDNSELS